jgi:hypothetical protein
MVVTVALAGAGFTAVVGGFVEVVTGVGLGAGSVGVGWVVIVAGAGLETDLVGIGAVVAGVGFGVTVTLGGFLMEAALGAVAELEERSFLLTGAAGETVVTTERLVGRTVEVEAGGGAEVVVDFEGG